MSGGPGRLFHAVAHRCGFWWTLLFVNLGGSLYGFWWYRNQLLSTPWWQWPLVPDSPGATFLLMLWLAFRLAGTNWKRTAIQVLGAIAFVSNMKYGLWTAVVLSAAGIRYGWEWEFVYLTLSHLGMWLQGFIFARFYAPGTVAAAVALLYMWGQDLVDYRILMTHPTLPYMDMFGFAKSAAVALSTLWGGYLLIRAWFDRAREAA